MNKSDYRKWEIVLVQLNPTQGSEIAKTRPCLIVSPNAINSVLNTLIVVPFTTSEKAYPTRLATKHKGKPGFLAFDQLRTIDKNRIFRKEGKLDMTLRETANTILSIMFSEK